MNGGPAAPAGFHGKLPAKGDFVTRRLPRGFVEVWDAWLQDVIADSRSLMGDAWLDAYLTSPVWRFVLGPGACSDQTFAGVMMPSVDRVGRYFPLSILAPLADGSGPVESAAAAASWFAAAETLARSALADEFDFDRFDAAVAALGAPAAVGAAAAASTDGGFRIDIADADSLDAVCRGLAGRWLSATYPRYSLWWTAGSEQMSPSFIACPGLPGADRFGAFLDGHWDRWGWSAPAPAPALTA